MTNSFVRVPPDGAGKKIHTTQHTIDANAVETQHTHISDWDKPENTLEINDKGAALISFSEGEPILDTYNNLKVSQESMIGYYEFSSDSYDDLFFNYTSDGGTMNYYSGTSSHALLTTSTSNSHSQKTTNRHHYYMPGSFGKITMVVSCGDTGKDGNQRKWGYYNEYNGVFWALDGTGITVGYRSDITGTIINTFIPQSSWNGDKLDGTGLSGVILDVTKSYQYFINFNWPSGVARYGIQHPIHGRIICHILSGSGTGPLTLLRKASLPLRFSNKNIGSVAGGSQLNVLMGVVQTNSETVKTYTFWRFGDLGCENKVVTTNTPILSLRPKIFLDNGNENSVNSYPETLSIYVSGTTTVKIGLVWSSLNILTGATWTMNSIDGPLEADSGATSIDVNSPDYWIWKTFYVNKDTPINIDLTPFFELNDEGILLTGGETHEKIFTIVGSTVNGSTAWIDMTLSYRGLY